MESVYGSESALKKKKATQQNKLVGLAQRLLQNKRVKLQRNQAVGDPLTGRIADDEGDLFADRGKTATGWGSCAATLLGSPRLPPNPPLASTIENNPLLGGAAATYFSAIVTHQAASQRLDWPQKLKPKQRSKSSWWVRVCAPPFAHGKRSQGAGEREARRAKREVIKFLL